MPLNSNSFGSLHSPPPPLLHSLRSVQCFGSESVDPKDEWAAVQLQKMYRKKMARRHLGDMSKQVSERRQAYEPLPN